MKKSPLPPVMVVATIFALSVTQVCAQNAGAGTGRRGGRNNAANPAAGNAGAGAGAGNPAGQGAGAASTGGDGSGTGSSGSGGFSGATGALNSVAGSISQVTGSGGGATTSNQTNSLESGTLLQVINKAFDTDSDFVNPENGTIYYKGHTLDPTQTRAFRSRFERYLSLSPTTDMKDYQKVLNEVTELLSTNNPGNVEQRMREAWTLLYQASEFAADGNDSLGVANQVFNTWRIRDENTADKVAASELQRAKSLQQRNLAYAADTAGREAATTANSTANSTASGLGAVAQTALSNPSGLASSSSGSSSSSTSTTSGTQNPTTPATNPTNNRGGNSTAPNNPETSIQGAVGAGTLLLSAEQLGETMSKITILQANNMLTVQQAKLQFQLEIVSLFIERKFQHAQIAASFYRFLFKGSQQDVDPKFKKDLGTFFGADGATSSSLGDLPFTIDTIESLSRNAIEDVKSGMAAVRSNYDEHQNIAALERLQETFFLGEFLPEVTQFEKDKRAKLYTLYKKTDEAHKLADLKDYEAVVKVSSEINDLTGDFRESEVTAAVRAQEQLSSLALSGAQQAQAIGDFDRAAAYTEKAASLWPLNPDIRSYSTNMSTVTSMGAQANILFDDAFKHGELRRIYDHRNELAVALMNDNQRGPEFQDVITKMSKIEMSLAQAKEMEAQNNSFAAWEALTAAAALSPNDVEVNQKKAELAPKVAAYAGATDKAKSAEDAGDTAASLTYYLAVQDLYPASQFARQGIERVAGQLLTQLSAETAAANAATSAAGGNDADSTSLAPVAAPAAK